MKMRILARTPAGRKAGCIVVGLVWASTCSWVTSSGHCGDAPERADLSPARTHIQSGDYAKADESLRQQLALHPEDPAALLLRGEVLIALSRPAEARAEIEKCLELESDRELAHFQLAAALTGLGLSEEARHHYAEEIRINEDPRVQTMAHLNLSLLFQKDRMWAEAGGEIEAVLRLRPDDKHLYGDLARVLTLGDALDEAGAVLRRGREVGFESARHQYNLGVSYYRQGSTTRAVDAFSRALEIDVTLAPAERGLGLALTRLGRKAEAAQHFRRYLELRPDADDADDVRGKLADSSE